MLFKQPYYIVVAPMLLQLAVFSSGRPSVNGRSRLIIDNAMKRDDGTYMCIAENAAGKIRALAAVRVKG